MHLLKPQPVTLVTFQMGFYLYPVSSGECPVRKVLFPTRQCIALFYWPFPKAVSTRYMEKRLFSLWLPLAFWELLLDTVFDFFSSLTVSCTSPVHAQGGLLMITRLFSQVSRYFTVMFNKFNHLIVSSWFLADIFLTGNNTDSCSYDLLVSNGASSSWHQILLILPFHWEIDQHFYWSIHILPEIVLFILGISKIDFLLFVSCSCSLQE